MLLWPVRLCGRLARKRSARRKTHARIPKLLDHTFVNIAFVAGGVRGSVDRLISIREFREAEFLSTGVLL